jgi:hypothetical protein
MIHVAPPHHVIDPWKIDLAARWYSLQSETLHIPDRFGFFSPGLPPLQAFEVERFTGLLICLSWIVLIGVVGLCCFPAARESAWWTIRVLVGFQFVIIAFYWVTICYGPFRDDEWGTFEYSENDNSVRLVVRIFQPLPT